MIRTNGDRYCKNPYFLHSICTNQSTNGNPSKAFTEVGSVQGFGTYYADNKTISEYGAIGSKRKSRRGLNSKASESNFQGVVRPPKLREKKQRPYSAPRHQGLRSKGLKNKVMGNGQLHPMANNQYGQIQGYSV